MGGEAAFWCFPQSWLERRGWADLQLISSPGPDAKLSDANISFWCNLVPGQRQNAR